MEIFILMNLWKDVGKQPYFRKLIVLIDIELSQVKNFFLN